MSHGHEDPFCRHRHHIPQQASIPPSAVLPDISPQRLLATLGEDFAMSRGTMEWRTLNEVRARNESV